MVEMENNPSLSRCFLLGKCTIDLSIKNRYPLTSSQPFVSGETLFFLWNAVGERDKYFSEELGKASEFAELFGVLVLPINPSCMLIYKKRIRT